MSSACVCHTDEYCFYCEVYIPLEREHGILRIKLTALIGYFRDQRDVELDENDFSTAQAYEIAANKLKEVLGHETSDTRDVAKPKRNDQCQQAK